MHTIDSGTIHVFSFKDGLLSRLGHDLRFSLGRFRIELDGTTVRAVFHTGSLVVDGAMSRGVLQTDLSVKDRGEIQDNAHAKVLAVSRHPEARFEGTVVAESGRVSGQLELCGKRAPVDLVVKAQGGRLTGEVTLQPSRWGIQPFKALLGALRLQDRVELRFDVPDPRA